MNTDAAMTQEQQTLPVIDKSELTRLEGLGDNCELGFALRRIGFEDGMLFRWTAIRPQVLLATLRADFEKIYEFDNLVPQLVGMARDLHYGAAWHTQMHSSLKEGTVEFDDDKETRRSIHAREASKIAYLIEKLRRKFEHPNPVFVIKANKGIPQRILEEIHYQLYRRVLSPRFLLLEVCLDPARAGAVELLDRNHMRGYLNHFAPYDKLYDRDDVSWMSILKQALAHNAEAPATTCSEPVTRCASQALVLPFPAGHAPDLCVPSLGDRRGGMPWLVAGNAWCRMIDEDTYRLHATGMEREATALRWTGVHLPPNFEVTINGWCAIAESAPVRATLEITAASGLKMRAQHVFDRAVAQSFAVATNVHMTNPLAVSLYVEPLRPLRAGERAVIDLDPITALPVDPSVAGRHR